MSSPFKSWDINAAIRDIYDIGERIQQFPIMLGEVARQMHDHLDHSFDIQTDKIEWMIPERGLTPEVKSLFKTWGFKENAKGYEYTFEGIPVQIRVIKRRYSFFERPDQRFYKVDDFKIPNPFEKYWKARFLIQ